MGRRAAEQARRGAAGRHALRQLERRDGAGLMARPRRRRGCRHPPARRLRNSDQGSGRRPVSGRSAGQEGACARDLVVCAPMKLIGAGLPRTATTTQMIALEMLGLPCYHMRDMMSDLETSVPQFRKAFDGDADWDEIFAGKESEVDWPASSPGRELMEVSPDAKILLSVRSAGGWVRSMEQTITRVFLGDSLLRRLVRARYEIAPPF